MLSGAVDDQLASAPTVTLKSPSHTNLLVGMASLESNREPDQDAMVQTVTLIRGEFERIFAWIVVTF